MDMLTLLPDVDTSSFDEDEYNAWLDEVFGKQGFVLTAGTDVIDTLRNNCIAHPPGRCFVSPPSDVITKRGYRDATAAAIMQWALEQRAAAARQQ